MIYVFLITLLLQITTPVLAGEKGLYYSDPKEGWWWYKYVEKEEKKEEPEKEKPVVKPPTRLPSLNDYTYEQLWGMHPDEFQALLIEIQKKAVMTLRDEDVREYLIMQQIASKKSLGFANVVAYVNQKSPELSVAKDYPIAAPGRTALVKAQLQDIENTIKNAKHDFAILNFHSPTCSFCLEQDKILGFFVEKYGWEIRKVYVDKEPALVSRFNITTVPTLMLIYRLSQDFFPISYGVASLSEIEDNLYRGIRLLRGEITPEEWSIYEFQKGGGFDVKQRPKGFKW